MKAAWDWHLPRETDADERALVDFAADCGFDTLIVDDPTSAMADRGRERGVSIIEIVHARPDAEFRTEHSDCLQTLLPVEDAILNALDEHAPEGYVRMAHRWFPLIHDSEFLCFEREPSMAYLERRVSDALEVADGVALDGFGFRNHYACFCDVCDALRAERTEAGSSIDSDALRAVSERTLVEAHEQLYEHAKAVDPDAVVINHVWPPFRPNPYYAHRLSLDYCTQTISWFYRPAWGLERVEFEAAEHARLEGDANAFVPFVGVYDDPSHLRSPERLRRELEIGLEYGEGSVVLSTLEALQNHSEIKRAVRNALVSDS